MIPKEVAPARAVRPRVWVGGFVYLATLVAAAGVFVLVWRAGSGLTAGGGSGVAGGGSEDAPSPPVGG